MSIPSGLSGISREGFSRSDHLDFLKGQIDHERELFGRGYSFVGHISPPHITSVPWQEQLQAIAAERGVSREQLVTIGDVMSTFSSDPSDRELLVMFDWAAVYAPTVASS